MHLGRSHRRPAQIPLTPLANLALLVLGLVVIAGLFAAARGPGMRFAAPAAYGAFDATAAVRVEVRSQGEIAVDGIAVAPEGLAGAVANGLARPGSVGVLLVVSPDATYQEMVAAYAAIAALPGPPRIAFPAKTLGGRG